MKDYDFELLVTPEEFKRNKEAHRMFSRKNKIKDFLFAVAVGIGTIAIIFLPALIENLW